MRLTRMRRPDESASSTTTSTSEPTGNADCAWDLFDSYKYLQHNYDTLHDLDRVIIGHLGRFFESLAPPSGWHGVDIGSGTNLYPAMAMIPLTETINLWEHSAANIAWLAREIRSCGKLWDQFWNALTASANIYQNVNRPESALADMTKIEKASIFNLPEAHWDIGTMFFVAESITGRKAEFELATKKFIRSLRPGAPFVAAFVENSHGYLVGTQRFPAVAITEDDIKKVLLGETTGYEIHHIASRQQFREGYDGMILVTGTRDQGTHVQPRQY